MLLLHQKVQLRFQVDNLSHLLRPYNFFLCYYLIYLKGSLLLFRDIQLEEIVFQSWVLGFLSPNLYKLLY